MKQCKRFHFEDVEQGDTLMLSRDEDEKRVVVVVVNKFVTTNFGEGVTYLGGDQRLHDVYLREYDSVTYVGPERLEDD